MGYFSICNRREIADTLPTTIMANLDKTHNVVVFGPAGSGKTSFIKACVYDDYRDEKFFNVIKIKTDKCDIYFNAYVVNDVSNIQCTGVSAGIAIFDTSKPDDYSSSIESIATFKRIIGNVPILLCASKSDKSDSISYDGVNCTFSTKINFGVTNPWKILVSRLAKEPVAYMLHMKKESVDSDYVTVTPQENDQTKTCKFIKTAGQSKGKMCGKNVSAGTDYCSDHPNGNTKGCNNTTIYNVLNSPFCGCGQDIVSFKSRKDANLHILKIVNDIATKEDDPEDKVSELLEFFTNLKIVPSVLL